jgi:hypothetical protein
VQLLTLLTFKVARQFSVQRIWYRLERLGLKTVSRPTKASSRSHLGQLGQRLGLGLRLGTQRLGLRLGTQRLGLGLVLGLGLGLEGLKHIPIIQFWAASPNRKKR